jgi:cyclic pyranopterin phosphate synthase
MTTNGILLARYGEDLKNAGLKHVNISIDSLNPIKYRDITRGGDLSRTLEGFQTAMQLGFDRVKINVVLMKDFNEDEIESFVDLTMKYPVDVRFIELMPFVGQEDIAIGGFLSGEVVLERCKDLVEVEKDYKSAPARYYQLPGAKGKVGLIEPLSHQFCGDCNRLRITADGHLLTCLHSRDEVDLRGSLENSEELKALIQNAIHEKPATHRLHEGFLMERDMGKIGG